MANGESGTPEPLYKFNVGQQVDFVNDYGVVFPGRMVTGTEMIGDWRGTPEPRYHLTPWETPWYPAHERNLRAAKPRA